MPREDLTLLSLPREIRFIIYDHLFSKRYFCYWPPHTSTPAHSLAILRTCSALNAEASITLYIHGIFQFHFPQTFDDLPHAIHPAGANFQRLMHVEITHWPRRRLLHSSKPLNAALINLLSHFSGSATRRSTFRILLKPLQRRVEEALESEVMSALATLTGFESVLIGFKTVPTGPMELTPGPEMPWRDVAAALGPVYERRRERLEEVMRAVVGRLEVGLGRGEVRDMEAQGVLYAREVEFRPRG